MSYEYKIFIDNKVKDKFFLELKTILLRDANLQCSLNQEKAIAFYFIDNQHCKNWGCDFELFFQENNLYFTCYAGNHKKIESIIQNTLDNLNIRSCLDEI